MQGPSSDSGDDKPFLFQWAISERQPLVYLGGPLRFVATFNPYQPCFRVLLCLYKFD